MPRIELQGIEKHYGSIHACNRLDLTIEDGEYLCVLGPTGAGKTTLLRILCGLTRPDQGKVLLDGKDITSWEPENRGAVMLSQTYSLFPQLTVAENVLFGPNIRNADEDIKKRLLADMLDMVRLTNRSTAFPRELSGGMQQRTALARALASGTQTLLLDEPLRALDARLRISLRHEIRSLAKSLGLTVVHVTHDQDEALVMGDRIAVLREGRIIQVGTPQEVFDDPVTPFVANFVGQANFFQGKVVGTEGGLKIRTDHGHVLPARKGQFDIGEEVLLSIKVGNTDVHREGEGYLEGKVERIIFEGRYLFLDLDVPGEGRISAKLPSWRLGRLSVGDMVKIRWAADTATGFRMPEGGLTNELRVE